MGGVTIHANFFESCTHFFLAIRAIIQKYFSRLSPFVHCLASAKAPVQGSSSQRRCARNVDPYGMNMPPALCHCAVCFQSLSPTKALTCSSWAIFLQHRSALIRPHFRGYSDQNSSKLKRHHFPSGILVSAPYLLYCRLYLTLLGDSFVDQDVVVHRWKDR